ncbi:kinase family protein [Medicago truncatula]|uniref:Kinase family protein n=1 Tax=Medicago truncatula TaxID=3880 RepID=A0A072UAX8_MEDTR|nr:kinase family protein [Medicago truncatula]
MIWVLLNSGYNVAEFEQIIIILYYALYSTKYCQIVALVALLNYCVAESEQTNIFCNLRLTMLVLFQNDSSATLLARVIGIIGPIGQSMLAKGRDTYKYFTKNHMLYERNQESNILEYLILKKTSEA